MSLAAAMRVPFLAVRFVAPETLLRGRLSGPRPGLSQATVEVFEAMRRRPERIEGAHLVADSRYPFDALLTAVAALLGQSEA
jgi:predicted kinase